MVMQYDDESNSHFMFCQDNMRFVQVSINGNTDLIQLDIDRNGIARGEYVLLSYDEAKSLASVLTHLAASTQDAPTEVEGDVD